MEELKLDRKKAEKLEHIFSAMCGIQSIITSVLTRKVDGLNNWSVTQNVKRLERRKNHLRNYLNGRRIEVVNDDYREGRLNAFILAFDLF